MTATRRPVRALLLAAVCTLGFAAAAARPAMAQDPKIPFEKYTLPNGLEVILVEDHSVPLVAVDVWYHVGSGDEVAGRSGFAHLFEHMMFQGTKNTGEDKHFEVLQTIGASDVNGTTNTNRTNYFEVVPSNQVETALWLESERMGYLPETITQKSLDNQREVVRNERRQSYDNVPYGKEQFAVSELLFPEGHPYRYMTIGKHEDLVAATADDVKGFFAKWYVPANATLTLAGDLDRAAAKRLVEKWFSTFPVTSKPAQPSVPVPAIAGPQRRTVEDSLAKLRRIHYAWNTPALFAPGDAELDLLASALAQQGTGRLYKTLVLEKRWARNVTAFQESRQLSSIFHVFADLQDDAPLDEVEKVIDQEVERMTKTPMDAAELHRGVVAFESQYVWGLESLLSRAENLQNCNHFTGDPDCITRDLDRYRKATPASVQAVAAQYLPKSGRVEVLTMPAAAPAEAPTSTTNATTTSAAPASQPAAKEAAVAAPVFPHEAFRAKQPAAAAAKTLVPPGIEHFQLADGVDVYLVERHALPTVSLDLAFPGGAIDDPAGKAGRAALCMNLLDDGTDKLDKVAFEEAQADIGSSVDAWAGSEQQGLSATTLTKNLGRTLDLWADTLLRPGLRQSDHERNVLQQMASIRQSKGAPTSIGRRVANAVFYGPENPFGQIVTEASTQAVTLDDCRAYPAAYLKPRGAQLYVVGDITRAQIESEIGRRLANWEGAPQPSIEAGPSKPQPAKLYFVDVPGAPQSYIVLAHPGPVRQAADYIPTNVMAGILGGDFSSRINMNLREDKGWAYGAGAGMRFTRHTSLFRAAASVRADATKDAVLELYKEVQRMATGTVTDAELQREKSGEALALPAQFATGESILGTYRDLVFYGLPMDYYQTFAQKVGAVTAAQVAEVAKAHLHPEDLRVLVVGDAKTQLPALREVVASGALGPGTVVELDADGRPVAASDAKPSR
ncbi:MAG TPA: pitrilysin family protein [Thermoanaerobaculia bacterium]|jgi:zinc protease|nr:pitrilysin family protein [Thermoanaerobaculia bacterium]